MHGFQARLQAGGWLVVGLPRYFCHGFEFAVVTLDFEAVNFPVEVVFIDFEHVGGDLAGFRVNLARCQGNGGTGHGGGARAVSA